MWESVGGPRSVPLRLSDATANALSTCGALVVVLDQIRTTDGLALVNATRSIPRRLDRNDLSTPGLLGLGSVTGFVHNEDDGSAIAAPINHPAAQSSRLAAGWSASQTLEMEASRLRA